MCTQGYDAARSLAFYQRPLVQTLLWARVPGDALVILGTVLFGVDVLRTRGKLRPVGESGSAACLAHENESEER